MNTFRLRISSPDGDVFDREVVMLSLRGADGDLAVLARHASFITSVVAGECKIELDDETEKIGVTDGGLLTVSQELVTLLAGSFVWKEE